MSDTLRDRVYLALANMFLTPRDADEVVEAVMAVLPPQEVSDEVAIRHAKKCCDFTPRCQCVCHREAALKRQQHD